MDHYITMSEPTDEELGTLLDVFQRPDYERGRIDALDNQHGLVAIRRAVRAGFYNEGRTQSYCTGCVPCPGVTRCHCDCHNFGISQAAA